VKSETSAGSPRSFLRVGLTGGIGAGKSTVAEIFEELGALVIDTDALAREAVAPGSDALREIARAWPQVVRSGALDRAALAAIVFGDPQARERLNAIVHPQVRRLAFARETAAAPGQIVVHVVPLLFETDYSAIVDRTVLVVAPVELRLARALARDGVNEDRIRARMAAQISPQQARVRADYVIENDADFEHLRARTRAVYEDLGRGWGS
jgi:dephospho-CoA kinase